MIEGVKIKKLRPICDERGRLMEILRSDDEIFQKFGQVYMTTVRPGVIKGWHYHKIQTDNMTVVHGMTKMVLYDARKDSPSHGQVAEYFVGIHNPILVQIPPMVYHGLKGIGDTEAIVINCPSEPYRHGEPDEYRVPPQSDEVPYSWDREDG